MNKWHAFLLVMALVIANVVLISFAARGSLGRSDPMLFMLFAVLWLACIVADVLVTTRSASQARWSVCIARVLFACVGVYVNFSAVAQIMYVA